MSQLVLIVPFDKHFLLIPCTKVSLVVVIYVDIFSQRWRPPGFSWSTHGRELHDSKWLLSQWFSLISITTTTIIIIITYISGFFSQIDLNQ